MHETPVEINKLLCDILCCYTYKTTILTAVLIHVIQSTFALIVYRVNNMLSVRGLGSIVLYILASNHYVYLTCDF